MIARIIDVETCTVVVRNPAEIYDFERQINFVRFLYHKAFYPGFRGSG